MECILKSTVLQHTHLKENQSIYLDCGGGGGLVGLFVFVGFFSWKETAARTYIGGIFPILILESLTNLDFVTKCNTAAIQTMNSTIFSLKE